MTGALAGGVTRSLALDAHGKSLGFALLGIEMPESLMQDYMQDPHAVNIRTGDTI
jgi:hypothetical protein